MEPPGLVAHGSLADWWQLRGKNPLLEVNPLHCTVSVSPKDHIKALSLPSDLLLAWLERSLVPLHSTPTLTPQVVDTPRPSRAPGHIVTMWPEDERHVTESMCVHVPWGAAAHVCKALCAM